MWDLSLNEKIDGFRTQVPHAYATEYQNEILFLFEREGSLHIRQENFKLEPAALSLPDVQAVGAVGGSSAGYLAVFYEGKVSFFDKNLTCIYTEKPDDQGTVDHRFYFDLTGTKACIKKGGHIKGIDLKAAKVVFDHEFPKPEFGRFLPNDMMLVAKEEGGIMFTDMEGKAITREGLTGKYFGCWIAAVSPNGSLLASRGPTD